MKFSELSDCEILTMRYIWMTHKDLSVAEIRKGIKEEFGKDYGRSTMCTFVRRLEKKGYLSPYSSEHKHGFLYHPTVDGDEFRRIQQKQFIDFWFNGSICDFVEFFYKNCEEGKISHEEAKRMRSILDETEDKD